MSEKKARMNERSKKPRGRKKPSPKIAKYHKTPVHRKSRAGMEIFLLVLVATCLFVLLGFYLRR